jgi:hypothetical protein
MISEFAMRTDAGIIATYPRGFRLAIHIATMIK